MTATMLQTNERTHTNEIPNCTENSNVTPQLTPFELVNRT